MENYGRASDEEGQLASALEKDHKTGTQGETRGGDASGKEPNGTAVPIINGLRRVPPPNIYAARQLPTTEIGGAAPKGPKYRGIQWQRVDSMLWVHL